MSKVNEEPDREEPVSFHVNFVLYFDLFVMIEFYGGGQPDSVLFLSLSRSRIRGAEPVLLQ